MFFIPQSTKLAIGLTLIGLGMLFVPLSGQTPGTAKLTVHVTGARNATGDIGIALYQSADGFPEDPSKVFRAKPAPIDSQTMSAEAVFDDIPQGTYAVAVFHDENKNGKLDKNFMGVPKEGYGISNNPKKRMGPPSFDEAKFSVDGAERTIEIKLNY